MITGHEVEYVTKRSAQLKFMNDAGKEILVYVDLVKSGNEITGLKPKTKNPDELEYLNANMGTILADLKK